MALTPNATATVNGLTIHEKIIPDGTRWKDADKARKAGFSANSLYKYEGLLCRTGKAEKVTMHNTDDLPGVNDDAEQYTRATYNENMGSVRVHYYVDDICAWQNLKAGTGLFKADPVGKAEVSYHSGDGTADKRSGNMTSISIECIMNDNAAHDAKAKDNAARLAAWLLHINGLTIDDLVSHTYWVNRYVGNDVTDVDKACTRLVSGLKWCPAYIFGSTNEKTALKNWLAFKQLVKGYMDALKGSKGETTTENKKPANSAEKSESAAQKTLYIVQCGAYDFKSNAQKQVARLKKSGFADSYFVYSGGKYLVRSGAFAVEENARKLLAKVKKLGYDAFIKTEKGTEAARKSVDEVAREVIKGLWGNGQERIAKLNAAGYNAADVQAKVNALLK